MSMPQNPTVGNAAPDQDREPIEVSKFWLTRGGNACISRFIFYSGKPYLDIRRNFIDQSGRFVATKKGITLSLRKIGELKAAIEKAEREARKLGLIDDEAAS
jgi:hypothetical protein